MDDHGASLVRDSAIWTGVGLFLLIFPIALLAAWRLLRPKTS